MRVAIATLEETTGDLGASAPLAIEGTLVARAADGDARAFRSIYDRHAPALYRFLCDMLRDAAAADEALQETFVRAHARMATLREAEKLRAWLYGIARLVVMEQLRARRDARDEVPDALDDEAAPTPSPESALLSAEAGKAFDAALAELRPDRRAALLMQADHELPYDSIAVNLGWSLAKVKVEIHRARHELRALFAKHLGGRK